MTEWICTLDTSEGIDDRTRSRVLSEAGLVTFVTDCVRAYSSIKFNRVSEAAAV